MEGTRLLMVAMAEQCRNVIRGWDKPVADLPEPLLPKHLLWMCDQIEKHAEEGSVTRLHRWIGFVQCAMMAHGMLDLEGAKAMFDRAKVAHGDPGADLADHLDEEAYFRLEIGGEA